MHSGEFSAQSPYPPIKGVEKNLHYAYILQQSFSGVVSELTAVMQYIYHHLRFEQDYQELAKGMLKIAIVEMRHFDMLGTAVQALGLDPQLKMRSGFFERFWDAGAVNYGYGNDYRQMLLLDIESEKKAIQNYEATIQKIPDTAIQSLIERIIEDEQLHIQWFQNML